MKNGVVIRERFSVLHFFCSKVFQQRKCRGMWSRDAPSSKRLGQEGCARGASQTSQSHWSFWSLLDCVCCSTERAWRRGRSGHERIGFSRAPRAAVAMLWSSAERWVDPRARARVCVWVCVCERERAHYALSVFMWRFTRLKYRLCHFCFLVK